MVVDKHFDISIIAVGQQGSFLKVIYVAALKLKLNLTRNLYGLAPAPQPWPGHLNIDQDSSILKTTLTNIDNIDKALLYQY